MIVVDAMCDIDEGLAEILLGAATTDGVTYCGPTPLQISREHERLLRDQTEKEESELMCVMEYACQMMQMRNSTTPKPVIVEEKVTTAEGSMTNRIMFTEVMMVEE
jgi:hypothetical protein